MLQGLTVKKEEFNFVSLISSVNKFRCQSNFPMALEGAFYSCSGVR